MSKPLNPKQQRLRFAEWEFEPLTNTLTNLARNSSERLEPKVRDLLSLLLLADRKVVSKDELMRHLWADVVVGDDALAKTVSRLRASLNDSAAKPKLLQTIPKRGYRMMVSAQPAFHKPRHEWIWFGLTGLCALLVFAFFFLSDSDTDSLIEEKLERADGLYMQFEEQSNEAALALYEDVLDVDADNSRAQAGVANALVQRVVRWPEEPFIIADEGASITSALASGQLNTPESKLMLERARLIAEKAVRRSPSDAQALKSLGFVYSAEGRFDRAIEVYQQAISVNSHEWRSMINLAELFRLQQRDEEALSMFIRAYNAMQAMFEKEPQHIGPWQPALGIVIAEQYQQNGAHANAAQWAEKVLNLVPFERSASTIFIDALRQQGKTGAAKNYCDSYASKLKPLSVCGELD